ncbi:MAG: glycogen synthase GlgA [Streptococcus sp.]|uniref:glycogen synthase GlgA n=1 Tax=unclassified Granulicatella TaxID=2630493 RepID=UPI001CB4D5A4|nr:MULTISPECIES: glycogen synthase GlgA [unclassified Granulicatella]MBF1709590.1 glycogen synthase GlgA [Streptococcus sp.]MBF1711841.1 glycogen synthase GlgA [Streptococcus sp.]MDK8380841.1 glycogen synthase GlgA [Granulicatella sp. UMB5615B]MDK8522693.1 glycogen synthase GlgA [Granulicatella sp. UMB5615A]
MKVCFIAAEAAPFVKVGGLGDVIGSLPKALRELGVDARVILPLYSSIDRERFGLKYKAYQFVDLGWRHSYCGIFETEVDGVPCYFVDNEQYFNRDSIYGQIDDGERFAFFSKAALEILPALDFKPDVVNVNDWHTALSVIYLDVLKSREAEFYKDMKSVLSIHNIEFQGRFNPYEMGNLFGLENKYFDALIYNGDVNLLKGAIQLADRVNTVSETYAREILDPYFSYGLDKILTVEQGKLRGILNGIDVDKFNPKTDPMIPVNYDLKTFEDKVQNKLAFQKEMDLEVNADIPLIGMVTRLTHQKGIDLILQASEEILKTGAQLVILGTGDAHYESALRSLEHYRHDRVRSILLFSNEMSAKIYAASDLFLMPSKTEPCGLSQLISMRYGTVPVVHRVGGLRDTVIPFTGVEGNGFTFESFQAGDMMDAIYRAMTCFYQSPDEWKQIIKNNLQKDVSWEQSAKKYLDLYHEVV